MLCSFLSKFTPRYSDGFVGKDAVLRLATPLLYLTSHAPDVTSFVDRQDARALGLTLAAATASVAAS